MGSVHNADFSSASMGYIPASRGSSPVGSAGDAVEKGVSPNEVYQDASNVDKAIIIKWSIIGGLFLILSLWIIIGHLHAKSRQRKGLPLLFYHRCLVASPKASSEKTASPYTANNLSTTEFYTPPPPAYNSTQAPPPTYRASEDTLRPDSPERLQISPSELEQQIAVPKRSLLSKIRSLGRKSN